MTTLTNFRNTLWIEIRKAQRSRMPLFTTLGFLLLPLIGALFMIILRDPDFARKLGLISAKAQLLGGSADWPTLLSMLSQAVGIGGVFLFGLLTTWVFGRELAEGTAVDWLAAPVSRVVILLAKFAVVAAWSLMMTVLMYAAGLGVGVLLQLPLGSPELFAHSTVQIFGTAAMMIGLSTTVAYVASFGRGYLAPVGFMFLTLVSAQVVAVLGWGDYFPWTVPALYSGMMPDAVVEPVSYWIVGCTTLLGIVLTLLWWQRADQA